MSKEIFEKGKEIGTELTDEELMNMVGGCHHKTKKKIIKPIKPIENEPILKYGIPVTMKYGIKPIEEIKPLYGIDPF